VAVLITGMHRSGTSMVTRLLHALGLDLGPRDDLLPPTEANEAGFWEHGPLVRLDEALLLRRWAGWDHPPETPVPAGDPGDADLRDRAVELLATFAGREPWGAKDPRFCLTLPFWLELLPGARVVVCVRDPHEVAQSLRRRNDFSVPHAIALWERHNRWALELAPPERRIVTHYDRFFHHPVDELRRLAGFLGLDGSDAAVAAALPEVRRRLRHGRAGDPDGPPLPAAVRDLHASLCAEAAWPPAAALADRVAATAA
jgi:hypothetical protein